ncbi:MAG: hypothetical protein ACKVYV_03230 [Limisphaerales bacterium]
MHALINAKQLRNSLPKLVAQVRRGARFTVLYRSRPAFQMVPVDQPVARAAAPKDDPLFGAGPVGRSKDGRTAADHDALLYGA